MNARRLFPVRSERGIEERWGATVRRTGPLCLAVLGVAVLALVALGRYAGPQQVQLFAVVLLLALLTGSAGSAAALLCVFAARLAGEPRTTWVGLTLCWYCLVPVPVITAHLLAPSQHPLLEAAVVLAQVSTAVLLLLLVWAPEPPSVAGVLRLATLGVLGVAASTVLLGVGFEDLAGTLVLSRPLGLVLGLAWIVAGLAVTATLPAWSHVVIGTGLTLIGSIQLWRSTTPESELIGLAPAFTAARLVAVLVVLGGSLALARRALVDLDREQADQERELRRAEAELARAQVRDHELRNGLAGIAGATRLLGRDEIVSRAVVSELNRLDVMLDARDPDPTTAYAIAPVVDGLVALRLSAGRVLAVALPPGVWAIGSSRTLAAVLTNVLANCERHAPGSPVEITAEVRAGQVILQIRDRGPGVPPGREEEMFGVGVRDDHAGGRGLGLALCRTLLAAEDATIHIEPADPSAPGCSVVVALPSAPVVVRAARPAPATGPRSLAS